MNDSDFQEKVRETQLMLPLVAKIWHQTIQQHLNAHGTGLSGLQYGMLRMLHLEPLTSSELSRKFQLDPSTLVPTVDTLAKRGLIVKTRDKNDRRRQPLSLTDDGLKLIRAVPFPVDNNDLADSLRQMGEAKVSQLSSLLRELILNTPDGKTALAEMQDRLMKHRDEELQKC